MPRIVRQHPRIRPALAAKNAAARVAGTVNAQRAAAAPMAATADPAAELRRAAETGDAPTLQRLLDGQPDVDARDASGRTALLLAAQHGQARAVDVLLAHGADPNAADANGNTPLKAAIEGHQPAIAAALQRAVAH
jgi:ankyrin repeat protein